MVVGGGTSVEPPESLPVFYLGKDDVLADGLAPLLARRGVFFTQLESAEAFAASGQALPPCLLLLETEMKESVAALHALNARTIAEDIDDSRDIGRAWDCGVDFIQGNFIQPPQEGLTFDFSAVPAG